MGVPPIARWFIRENRWNIPFKWIIPPIAGWFISWEIPNKMDDHPVVMDDHDLVLKAMVMTGDTR